MLMGYFFPEDHSMLLNIYIVSVVFSDAKIFPTKLEHSVLAFAYIFFGIASGLARHFLEVHNKNIKCT